MSGRKSAGDVPGKQQDNKLQGGQQQTSSNDLPTDQRNDIDELSRAADQNRTRKPGSQSNSSGQHNNGRGGGK